MLFCLVLEAQSARKPAPRKLLVISICGLDGRFLNEPPSRVKIPNIRRMMRQGIVSTGVIGVAPSEAWPSEIALLSGVRPDQEAAAAGDLRSAASRAGLKVASIYWPRAAGGEITYDFPALREPHKGENIKFEDVAQKASPTGLAERIEKAAAGFEKELWDDDSAARAATYLLKNENPDLLFVNFMELDSEQRETGALSVYARDQLANEDDLIGQIVAAAPKGTVVALVSGNGFENENFVVRPHVLLKQDKIEIEDGLIGTPDPNTAARIRKLLTDGHRHGLSREVTMGEAKSKNPALGHWVAAFDTPQNYIAVADDKGPALGPGSHLGVNGLWPLRPGYRSVLVISGEALSPKRLGEIDLLQIAPTLADIAGIKLPQAKGKSLWQ